MLKVYMTGLMYFSGCDAPQPRVYAPDGRDDAIAHHATFWVAVDCVNMAETSWWPGFWSLRHLEVPGEDGFVIEFRIPEPSRVWFPDEGNTLKCNMANNDLPRMKKQHFNGELEDFEVDPETAETIADVTIRGGSIEARRLGRAGLLEWTIADPAELVITAVPLGSDVGHSIALVPPGEGPVEVVFANTHDVFMDPKGDTRAGDHVGLFRKLNPPGMRGTGLSLVSEKGRGNVGQVKTADIALKFLKEIAYTCGDTPPCC